ncbi:hypothetical protein GU243_10960 [Pseudarthrobacter psychrotolerans]|uniref:Glycosyltransferase n=1 Tax=Pseudarthrobacter psychrotolerans TaxID=2697569 RepID=A0A6P1NIK6_9MICC|nr:glycosyltransferase family 4 protein [Pseudarthrobacter psychrotolerans]QHK20166.1 hypothetical protein GU243_10960 [Pseudarthrobacter psychrotolerans]
MEKTISEKLMRAHVLTTYPVADASRRLRIEPLVSEMRRRGIEVRVHQLLSDSAFGRKNGSPLDRAYVLVVLLVGILARLLLLARRCDILIVHREAFPFFTPLFEQMGAKNSRISILDVDDAIYAAPTHTRDWRQFLRNPTKASEFSTIFDVIFCGNEMLKEKFGRDSAISFVSPTCPPPETFDIVRQKNDKIIIMWTGSQSTLGSIKGILPDVLQLCEEDDLELHILGGANINELEPHPRLFAARWTSDAERDLLARASIGLMPLPDTQWERGKSGYKAILYLCAGLRAVVSPVGINRRLSEEFPAISAVEDDHWSAEIRHAVEEVRRGGPEGYSRDMARTQFGSSSNATRAVDIMLEGVTGEKNPLRG